MRKHNLMWILWPSFLMAIVTSGIVFALLDPIDLILHNFQPTSRESVYTACFFFFWCMMAASSALSMWLAPKPTQEEDDSF